MTINQITTGEQAVTETGAVTGTLTTSSLSAPFTLKARVRGLAAGDTVKFAFEDTADSSEFGDAVEVCSFDILGGMPIEGVTYSFRDYEVPSMRYGATHNELRLNCYAISAGTATVIAWLE